MLAHQSSVLGTASRDQTGVRKGAEGERHSQTGNPLRKMGSGDSGRHGDLGESRLQLHLELWRALLRLPREVQRFPA